MIGDTSESCEGGLDTFTALSSILILVVVSGVVIGAMYLGGGAEAVRRQVPMIAAVIVGGAALLFIVLPRANAQFGAETVGLVLLVATLGLSVARSRRTGVSLTRPVTGPTGRTVQPRQMVLLWLGLSVILIVGVTVIAIALRQ
jgi:hypothetical protein